MVNSACQGASSGGGIDELEGEIEKGGDHRRRPPLPHRLLIPARTMLKQTWQPDGRETPHLQALRLRLQAKATLERQLTCELFVRSLRLFVLPDRRP